MIPDDARHLDILQRAVLEERQIMLDYRGPRAEPTRRRVDPYGLVTKASVWYLIAGTEQGRRTFRVSRIVDVELLATPADRPPDFDLSAAWSEIKADFGAMVSADAVRSEVEAEPWTLGPLRSLPAVEVHVESDRRASDGRLCLTVTAGGLAQLAHALAGFGSALRVLGPPDVHQELARLGRDLVGAYESSSAGD